MGMEQQTIKNAGKMGFGEVTTMGMGFLGDAMNIYSAVSAFNMSQEQGDNAAISLTKGALDFGIGELFYGSMFNEGFAGGFLGMAGTIAVTTGAELASQKMKHNAEVIGKGSEELKGIGSGHFDMTQSGYTMRQRSLNAIRSNGANINSAFGNEARNYYLGL